MGLFEILSKGVKAMIEEANTPESFKTGEKFENYVRQLLFIDKHYDLVERTHNYVTNKDHVESSLKPDFTFRDKVTKKEFYVEAKFRTGVFNGKIMWCNEKQLARYLEHNKQKPVFLILGVGGDPKSPEFVSLIPLAQAKYTGLFLSIVEKFEIQPGRPIFSKALWTR
jgi:hypothetical protein